mgnify:CR=1 FL=1
MTDKPKHRAHAYYCEICDTPMPNGKKRKMDVMLCMVCIRSPPEHMLCGATTAKGTPCRAIGRFNGRCHNHKESQSTSS